MEYEDYENPGSLLLTAILALFIYIGFWLVAGIGVVNLWNWLVK